MKYAISILITLLFVNVCLATDSTRYFKFTHFNNFTQKQFDYKENSKLKIKTNNGEMYRGKIKIINDSQITISKYNKLVLIIDTLHEDSIIKVAVLTAFNKVGGSILIAAGTSITIGGFYSYPHPNFIESFFLLLSTGYGVIMDLMGTIMVINRYRTGEFRIKQYVSYF